VLHPTPVSAEVELRDGQIAVPWQRGRHSVAEEVAIGAMEASKLEFENMKFRVCVVDKYSHDDIGGHDAGGS
jgi:hypothetical protein